ncbi:MAG: hypothetical protein JXM79_11080 [Sedimentisphaerales bacterium]|nr:hypothetical protein [Sedimentisphaerales bacterium]
MFWRKKNPVIINVFHSAIERCPVTAWTVPYRRQRLSCLVERYKSADQVSVFVDGQPVEESQWRRLRIRPGQRVDILPTPGFFNLFFSASAWASLSFGAKVFWTVASMAAYTAVSYYGGKLIAGSYGQADNSLGDSVNYAWNPQTIQQEGGPIPRAWGRCQHVGNIVARWTDVNDDGDEVLYLLNCYGEGPVEGPVDGQLYVNDQPINQISGVTTDTRRGTLDQTVIEGFEQHKLEYQKQVEITSAGGWEYFTTPNNFFDNIEFTVEFPNGLRHWNKSGEAGLLSVEFVVQIAEKDSEDWVTILNPTVTSAQLSPIYRAYTVYPNTAGFMIERGKQYTLRFKKYTIDSTSERAINDFGLRSVREVVDVAFTRPGKVLRSIIAVGTEQLSGDISVKDVWDGRIVNVYNGSSWVLQYSRNRAWVVFDELTQPVIAGNGDDVPYSIVRYEGVDPSHIDTALFYEWAQWCDQQVTDGAGGTEARMTCDYIADTDTDVWTLAHRLANIGRMYLYWQGTTLTGWLDAAVASITDLVTFENMVDADEWTNSWTAAEELAGRMNVWYRDALEGYERKKVSGWNPDAGNYKRTVDIEGDGVTGKTLGARVMNHALKRNELIRNINQFRQYKDAFRYRLGQVVRVQSTAAEWGDAYQVAAAVDDQTVRLDRAVTASPGDALYLRTYNPSTETIQVEAYTVDAVDGAEVTIQETFIVTPVAGWVAAIGETVLRRIIKLEFESEHFVTLSVEIYDTDLFGSDAIEPVNSNPGYVWAESLKKLHQYPTRSEVLALIAESQTPALNTDTPSMSNMTWAGNEIDTVTWSATDDDEALQWRYQGTTYSIAAGSTTDRFILWLPEAPRLFSTTDDEAVAQAALQSGAWFVCENKDGVPFVTQPFRLIWAGCLQAGTITSQLAILGAAAVDTLEIAGNAVTIPTSAYTEGEIQITPVDTYVTVQSLTFTSTGSPVSLHLSLQPYQTPASAYQYRFALYLDGTEAGNLVWESNTIQVIYAYEPPVSFSLEDTPGSGEHTYYLRAKANNATYCYVRQRSLLALEVKR